MRTLDIDHPDVDGMAGTPLIFNTPEGAVISIGGGATTSGIGDIRINLMWKVTKTIDGIPREIYLKCPHSKFSMSTDFNRRGSVVEMVGNYCRYHLFEDDGCMKAIRIASGYDRDIDKWGETLANAIGQAMGFSPIGESLVAEIIIPILASADTMVF